jgi:hypothetical protein
MELCPSKRFGENVGKLVLGVDVTSLHTPVLMKWYLIRMCLLLSWKTGFLATGQCQSRLAELN